jgi:Mg2+ and Co2+ transporter CorA
MTATLVSKSDQEVAEAAPVTFILTPDHLVTLRYQDYTAFKYFSQDLQKNPNNYRAADAALTGLLEHIVERLADLLERVGAETESLSNDLFSLKASKGLTQPPMRGAAKKKRKVLKPREVLNRVGATGNLDANTGTAVMDMLLSIVDEARKTLIVVTHDTRMAERGDRRLILQEGKLVAG